jgi:hypothetical protein
MASLSGGSLGGWLVRVGMCDRTHLGNEKRQHSQSCDAKFDAMRPFEQAQPFMHKHTHAFRPAQEEVGQD